MIFPAMMALALAVDAVVGWPERFYRRIGHPVTWMGRLVSAIETRWNRGAPVPRRIGGACCVLAVTAAAAVPAWAVQAQLPEGAPGLVLGAILAWPFIAVRSLHDHVSAVARPLTSGDLAEARRAVSMIVGRDPARLDDRGIARAALESLSENASDGVVAPLFWGAVAGLPGIVAYKAINTMDSMIGHRNERYEDFGKVAARFDDIVNIVPARLTGLMIVLVSGRPRTSLRVMMRDAHRHRSPNAGWPEAAMAGALGIRLSGPRVYGDRVAEEPWLNAGAADPAPGDLARGLALYVRAMLLCGAGLLALALV
jgi:adenosylcobinamide-phosphate synthase